MYFSEWPRRQVMHDLHAVALATEGAFPAKQGTSLSRKLQAAVETPDLRLETDDLYLDTLAALNAAAADAGGTDAAAFALALLLADAMNGQVGPDGPHLGWPALAPAVRGQSRARRAALARGFVAAADQAYADLPDPPHGDILQGQDRDSVVPPLVQLARRLGGNLGAVANADYGMDADRHAAALRAVLNHPECRFPKGDRWYPAEVVELTGHVPGEAGFLPCIALLILDDIHYDGDYDQLTFRWMNNAQVFLEAPGDWRNPILRGIRFVMENMPPGHWDPYFDWKPARIAEKAAFIPWFDDAAAAA